MSWKRSWTSHSKKTVLLGFTIEDACKRSVQCNQTSLCYWLENCPLLWYTQCLEWKRVAGMITDDVNGAFDWVLRNRLLFWVQFRGWPNCFIEWIWSFLTEFSPRIHFEGITTDSIPMKCGFPQRFSVLSVLLLCIESLLHSSPGKLEYANDVAFFASGSTLDYFNTKLQHQLDLTLD